MTTYKTLTEARAAKVDGTQAIAEIEHKIDGRCFIGIRTHYKGFEHAYNTRADVRKVLADVTKLYCGHDKHTAQEIAAIVAEVNNNIRCERCGVKVDPTTCYHQEEWARLGASKVQVRTHYCDSCTRLLQTIGAGEHTEMQDRAAHVPSYEPTTKQD